VLYVGARTLGKRCPRTRVCGSEDTEGKVSPHPRWRVRGHPGQMSPHPVRARVEERSNLCAAVGGHQRYADGYSRSHERAPRPRLLRPLGRATARARARSRVSPSGIGDERPNTTVACAHAGGETGDRRPATPRSDRARGRDLPAPRRDRAPRGALRRSTRQLRSGRTALDRRDHAPPVSLGSVILPAPHS
jgi:hypothetical protein